MALLSISAAARAVGCNRATIQRKIKKGEITCSYDSGTKSPQVDTSELLRVFGELAATGTKTVAGQPPAQVDAAEVIRLLQAQLETVQKQLVVAQERETRVLTMLEREQAARRRLESRMLPSPEAEEGEGQRAWWNPRSWFF